MSRVTAKTVQLEVSTAKPNMNTGTNSVLKTQLKYLQDTTSAISADYQYLKQREIMHLASVFFLFVILVISFLSHS
jgi:predicted component of type VI protein secretion system